MTKGKKGDKSNCAGEAQMFPACNIYVVKRGQSRPSFGAAGGFGPNSEVPHGLETSFLFADVVLEGGQLRRCH